MRKVFHKLHLWLSIPLGVFLSLICLTGAILVFETEIKECMSPELYRVEVKEGEVKLSPSQLAAAVMRQVPDTLVVSGIQYYADAERACMVSFKNGGRRQLSVNPYTGEVNGWVGISKFFQTVKGLHRWFLHQPESKSDKTLGRLTVGVSTLLFVVILVSGFVIWMPRKMKNLKQRLTVSFTKGWRRFWYDSHVAWGFYATLFLLLMSLTGLYWSFGWYRSLATSLFVGEVKKEQTAAVPAAVKQGKRRPSADYLQAWDRVYEEIAHRYPQYTWISLEQKQASVSTRSLSATRRADVLTFDKATGAVLDVQRYADIPASKTLKGTFYSLHTGNWGGLWTKVLYFLAALIGAVLPWSGYYLWWKKRKAKQKQKRKAL